MINSSTTTIQPVHAPAKNLPNPTVDTTQPDPNPFQAALALVLGIESNQITVSASDAAGPASNAYLTQQVDAEVEYAIDVSVPPADPALISVPVPQLAPTPTFTPIRAGNVKAEHAIQSNTIHRLATDQLTGTRTLLPEVVPEFPVSAGRHFSAMPSGEQIATTTQEFDLAEPGKLLSSTEFGLQREVLFSDGGSSLSSAGPASAPSLSLAAPAIQIHRSVADHIASAQPDRIEARVGERGWGQGLGEKLLWMTSQKHQMAELRLNPPDLGPLKITITLDQNQASAQFVSAHASVRDAIEAAMPRLREMFADSGISLGNTSVGTETFREQSQQQSAAPPVQRSASLQDAGRITSGERLLQRSRGLVDTFA